MIKIHCKYDELIDPSKLKNHPKNRNKHGQDQIERLAELYKYHGIRHPIIVSNLSGFIVAGHGRKLAAIRAGIKEMPVVYQDFDSSEAEYAFIQADNAIALWAELDMSGINTDIQDLGPDFNIDMLGIKDFTIDVAEKDEEKQNESLDLVFKFKIEVDCEDEEKQQFLTEELEQRGFKVRVLI
jgi:ParB-like nuclease domain